MVHGELQSAQMYSRKWCLQKTIIPNSFTKIVSHKLFRIPTIDFGVIQGQENTFGNNQQRRLDEKVNARTECTAPKIDAQATGR